MINNETFSEMSTNNNQFVLSYELICLLQWLLERDAEKIKKIIKKALVSGLGDEIGNSGKQWNDNPYIAEDLQGNIIEFFGMLEILLAEALDEQALQKVIEKKLMPSIDQIDVGACDAFTLQSSIQKAAESLEQHPEKDPQAVLFHELLKRWKPRKKAEIN